MISDFFILMCFYVIYKLIIFRYDTIIIKYNKFVTNDYLNFKLNKIWNRVYKIVQMIEFFNCFDQSLFLKI